MLGECSLTICCTGLTNRKFWQIENNNNTDVQMFFY